MLYLLIMGLLIYGGLVLFLYFIQERMIYFPTRNWDGTPADVGLDYETVWLTTRDAVKISGWFVVAPQAKGTVLFFHGNGGNMSHRLNLLQNLHGMGVNTLIIDYRGYGQSEGTVSEQGTYEDAEAAWQYLITEKQVAPDKIVIWGNSLGGGVASWLAQQHPPAGLILSSTFTSAVDVAAEVYPFLPVSLMARVRYETAQRLPHIQSPMLIIHSPSDDVIPYQHGLNLFEIAPEPKQFLQISGPHNASWLNNSIYRQTVERFIRTE